MISYLQEACGVLLASRMRTVLALLGLTVGVAAVVAIQILGHATAGALTGIFKGLSQQTFLAYPDSRTGFDPKSGFRLTDISAIALLPNVRTAIPYSQSALTARLGHASAQLNLAPVGADPEFLTEPVQQGRAITAQEITQSARVCLVSADAAAKLAPSGEPLLGRRTRIGAYNYTIVGVLKPPPTGAVNLDFSPDVLVPYSTYVREYLRGSTKIYQVQVLVRDQTRMSETERAVQSYLRTTTGDKFNYQTFDIGKIAGFFNTSFAIISFVVGAIAAISLVVAGIGIMNILLVSITERTREIGVRKAIGARRSQILLQFFLEAFILASTGCFLGAIVGLLAGWYVNERYIIKISGVIVAIPWEQSILIAVGFAAIVTLAFGTYPAYRAALLDPIEALRYE